MPVVGGQRWVPLYYEMHSYIDIMIMRLIYIRPWPRKCRLPMPRRCIQINEPTTFVDIAVGRLSGRTLDSSSPARRGSQGDAGVFSIPQPAWPTA